MGSSSSKNKNKKTDEVEYSSDEAQRGKELKATLDTHIAAFVEEHCIVHKLAFVPVNLIEKIWGDYSKEKGFDGLLNEYYIRHYKYNGCVSFHDTVTVDHHSNMYIGITFRISIYI